MFLRKMHGLVTVLQESSLTFQFFVSEFCSKLVSRDIENKASCILKQKEKQIRILYKNINKLSTGCFSSEYPNTLLENVSLFLVWYILTVADLMEEAGAHTPHTFGDIYNNPHPPPQRCSR